MIIPDPDRANGLDPIGPRSANSVNKQDESSAPSLLGLEYEKVRSKGSTVKEAAGAVTVKEELVP